MSSQHHNLLSNSVLSARTPESPDVSGRLTGEGGGGVDAMVSGYQQRVQCRRKFAEGLKNILSGLDDRAAVCNTVCCSTFRPPRRVGDPRYGLDAVGLAVRKTKQKKLSDKDVRCPRFQSGPGFIYGICPPSGSLRTNWWVQSIMPTVTHDGTGDRTARQWHCGGLSAR